MPVYAPISEGHNGISTGVPERAAILTCLNEDDSVYRITGCAAFGAHENSYRICGEKGQIENLRDGSGRVLLSYDHWNIPEGVSEERSCYEPVLDDKDFALAQKAGHGGGDFLVIREFLNCIREDRRPVFDVYFATTMASVAILGHRSMMEKGNPYDIPDLRLNKDREKFRHDTLTPFYGTDGSEPSIPCSANSFYGLTDSGRAEYDERVKVHFENKENNKE